MVRTKKSGTYKMQLVPGFWLLKWSKIDATEAEGWKSEGDNNTVYYCAMFY